jgi:hypothetical protein
MHTFNFTFLAVLGCIVVTLVGATPLGARAAPAEAAIDRRLYVILQRHLKWRGSDRIENPSPAQFAIQIFARSAITILPPKIAPIFVWQIVTTHSACYSAMQPLGCSSASLIAGRPIKAFSHFCQPTVIYIMVTLLEI